MGKTTLHLRNKMPCATHQMQMTMKWCCFMLALVTMPLSAVTTKPQTTAGLKAGEYQRVVAHQRQYLLYIPKSLPAGEFVPLVLFFHGGGGHMTHAARSYGWRQTAEREGFVVAFPNGYSRFPGGRFASWNAGNCCGDARDKQINDIAFVKDVLADIQQQLPIDQNRIFATGMSNGGMLAHRLACDMAGTFRAIAAVAGTDNTVLCQPARPVSVLHIHALDDSHVLFAGGAGKDAFRDKNKITEFKSVPDTIKGWQQRLQLQGAPQRVLNVPGAYADLWQNKDGRTQLKLLVTSTGGHSWPGGKAVRGKTPSKAIDANTMIWQFFNSQLP
ncbi:alpha/beta hydrolase family esterase [Rheinheimera sp. 4Y26]|uniref:extracellular catalytic domain type 1 short-chain-length polyhydroxyalkanoate depolymerase n=1 Tax=Rheinheimera sp. 4Y26 TaxID=2977811 RepID=UPI0021B0E176|nr:PHB depolymerase family esterase [Rheinheimera sp. 4Y26]MCT6698056.1 prolyl oligopeptidase family serine peptidase [Rheinheimera sp. 4Y26]